MFPPSCYATLMKRPFISVLLARRTSQWTPTSRFWSDGVRIRQRVKLVCRNAVKTQLTTRQPQSLFKAMSAPCTATFSGFGKQNKHRSQAVEETQAHKVQTQWNRAQSKHSPKAMESKRRQINSRPCERAQIDTLQAQVEKQTGTNIV